MTFYVSLLFSSWYFNKMPGVSGEKRKLNTYSVALQRSGLQKKLTSTAFGDITKCHQGISHLSRQIRQRLVSVAHLTAAIQTSLISLPPSFGDSYAAEFPGGRCHLLPWHHGTQQKGPESWINAQVAQSRHCIGNGVRDEHGVCLRLAQRGAGTAALAFM